MVRHIVNHSLLVCSPYFGNFLPKLSSSTLPDQNVQFDQHLVPIWGMAMNKQVLDKAIAFIDSWLLYRYERLEIPGFVVTIAHDGEIAFNQAYGYANLEEGERMTTDHVFRIASHSKTFTATSIMQLAEEKRLGIDEPVVKYVPWLSQHQDPRLKQITARQLMSHSAGVIRDGLDSNYWHLNNPFPDFAEFKSQMTETDLIFDNNRKMKYSNFGYTLLGTLIEEVSGMPFNRYAQEKIMAPLGLSDTGPEFTPDVMPRLVTGYTRPDREKHRLPITRDIDTRAMSPATGFYSTGSDLCRYFQAQFIGSGKLLDDQSKKEMQRAQWTVKRSSDDEEYGLGFSLDHFGERNLFGHGGGFPGQKTKTFCDPEAKLVVVVLANCIDGEARLMGKGIIASVIEHFERSAEQAEPSSINELRRFEGRFMDLWNEINIVENGKKLVAVYPSSWLPFGHDSETQLLERIDDRTWRIASATSIDSEGELVKYNFDGNGAIKSINYAGSDMLPEAEYNKLLAKKKAERSPVALPS